MRDASALPKNPINKETILQQFIASVKKKYSDETKEIILFGSFARREATEESDIDVLVITSGNRFEMQKNLSEITVEILLRTGVYISAKAVSVEEYSFMKKINTGFYQNIAREIRERADYGIGYEFTHEEAESVIEYSERFLGMVKKAIKELSSMKGG
jgi:predicted nucleotidyltransferase